MTADLILEESSVIVAAPQLKVAGAEFVLDGRTTDAIGPRRALVHTATDALTVNADGDYRGGVQVRGALTIDVPVLKVGGGVAPHYDLEPLDLGATVRKLLDQVEALREHAEKLQVEATIRGEANHYTQEGWRWCKRCSGLHFAPNVSRSVCWATKKPHAADNSASYTLFPIKSRHGGQDGWAWCRKCQGLCHGDGAASGVCPAGGAHDRSASPPYVVWADNYPASTFSRQDNWRHCTQCKSMYHGGIAGSCPVTNAGHVAGGSSNYHLQY